MLHNKYIIKTARKYTINRQFYVRNLHSKIEDL